MYFAVEVRLGKLGIIPKFPWILPGSHNLPKPFMKVKRRAPKKNQGVIVGRNISVVSTFYCFFNFFAPWLLLEKQVLQSLYEEFPRFSPCFFGKAAAVPPFSKSNWFPRYVKEDLIIPHNVSFYELIKAPKIRWIQALMIEGMKNKEKQQILSESLVVPTQVYKGLRESARIQDHQDPEIIWPN